MGPRSLRLWERTLMCISREAHLQRGRAYVAADVNASNMYNGPPQTKGKKMESLRSPPQMTVPLQ